MAMLKILSGTYRSRSLQAPPDSDLTRPCGARVRQSIFGMLQGWFEDASVLDLFAGVGTMGLEAISRGAASAVMIEQNHQVYTLLEANIEALGCRDRATAIMGDALGPACLLRARTPVDLVFVDPPYVMMREEASRRRVLQQIASSRELMGDSGFVVLRSPLGPGAIDLGVAGFAGPEPHRYRPGMWALLYAPAPTMSEPAVTSSTTEPSSDDEAPSGG